MQMIKDLPLILHPYSPRQREVRVQMLDVAFDQTHRRFHDGIKVTRHGIHAIVHVHFLRLLDSSVQTSLGIYIHDQLGIWKGYRVRR